MQGRFDLHLHTRASDGRLQPEALVAMAATAGLACIAITDHDTCAGVSRALSEGKRLGFPVIAGAEFTAQSAGELHILGYGMCIDSAPWGAFTAEQQRRRAARNSLMLQRLSDLDLVLPQEYLPQNATGEYGRVHVARGLVSAGYADSVQQAFDRYLGEGRPACVPRMKFTAAQLIEAIRQARGDAVLAHPGRLGMTAQEMKTLIPELHALGLAGLEAFYPSHSSEESDFYRQLALQNGLICTYGSDWHALEPGGLAQGFDRFSIPEGTYDWLDGLLKRQEGLDERQ